MDKGTEPILGLHLSHQMGQFVVGAPGQHEGIQVAGVWGAVCHFLPSPAFERQVKVQGSSMQPWTNHFPSLTFGSLTGRMGLERARVLGLPSGALEMEQAFFCGRPVPL